MPPYKYEDYRNAYAGTIGDLIGKKGDVQARGRVAAGDALARGTELSGLAWGRGIQDAGQSVSNAMTLAPRRRLDQQATEANDLHLRAAKREERGQQAVSSMMQGAQSPAGANGPSPESYLDQNGLFDVQKMTQALASGGYGDIAPSLLQGAERINASITQHQEYQRKVDAAHAVLIGDTAWGALQLAKTGTPLEQALDFAALPGLATKRFDPAEYQQVKSKILSLPPDQQQAMLSSLVDQAAKLSPKDEKKPGEGSVDRYGRVAVPIPATPKTTTINGQLVDDATGAPIGQPIPPQAPVVNPETERHNRELEKRATDAAAEERRHHLATEGAAGSDKTDLTPAGLDAAALNYAKTGMLPPLGMGDKTTRKQIINRAAEMMPELDIASAKADYGANQDALKSLMKQREALGAFESTALKNLDVFIAAAGKVPDTGSPMLNRPIRALNESMLGGEALTAYNTARRTVIPEFAKILANPGLSGQLSDSARHEIEGVVSGSATLAQTIAAAKILKQDTANRRTSYDDQIAGIQARIKKGSSESLSSGDKKDPMGIR